MRRARIIGVWLVWPDNEEIHCNRKLAAGIGMPALEPSTASAFWMLA